MYSLADYVWMIADGERVAAYAEALRRQIRPGMRVLDLGAGFGFFSLLAIRAGAAHVDAVEMNPVIHLGPRLAAANGCADRIAFHHVDVRRLTLDRPADMLITDLRGPTPFGRRSLEVLIHARDHLVRRNAGIIAARDTLYAAPVTSPAAVRREIHRAHRQQDVDLGPIERVLFDTPMRYTVAAEDLVAAGKPWAVLNYSTLDELTIAGDVHSTCERRARVEGIAVWFQSDLGAGIGFSSEPGGRIAAYKQLFIPLRVPFDVEPGDRLRIALSTRQVRENYLWEWTVWLTGQTGGPREMARQNSLAELVIDPGAFTDTSADAIPALGAQGRLLRELLSRIDGRATIASLAAELCAADPAVLRDCHAAAEFVASWTRALERLERGTE